MEPLVILFVACLFLPMAEQKTLYLITAPNVVHVGMDETIAVQVFEAHTSVFITVYMKEPRVWGQNIISQKYRVELNQTNNFTQVILAQVLPEKTKHLNFAGTAQYAVLVAEFPSEVHVQQVIRLSSRPYFIYIVTDKPIYQPGEIVQYKIFTLDQGMNPINSILTVEVLNSKGKVIGSVGDRHDSKLVQSGKITTSPEMLGRYQIRAKVSENSEYQGLISFQVRHYVLPKFDVRIIPDRPYYVVTDSSFPLTIQVPDKSDSKLRGTVLFGMRTTSGQRTYLSGLNETFLIQNGTARVVLHSDELVNSIKRTGGMDRFKTNTLCITAKIEVHKGHIETKVLDNIVFRRSPYDINLSAIKAYFIPGAPFNFLIKVTYPDGSFASGVHLDVSLFDTGLPQLNGTGLTDVIGELGFVVNVPWSAQNMRINVIAGKSSTGFEKMHKLVKKTHSDSNRYLHITVPHVLLYPRDSITVHLTAISQQDISNVHYYYYMVVGRGKVLDFGSVERVPGATFELPITREMVPHFRILAYYISNYNHKKEIIMDSVLVEVESLCHTQFQADSALRPYHGSYELLLTVLSESPANIFVQAMDTRLEELNTQDAINMKQVFEDLKSYGFALKFISNSKTQLAESTASAFEVDTIPKLDTVLRTQIVRLIQSHSSMEALYKSAEDVRDNLINPTAPGIPMWSLKTVPGNKTFRLTFDRPPPRAWEIRVLSLSRENGLCLAKPKLLILDEPYSIPPREMEIMKAIELVG
ncbi:complement C3-like isoform X2 [Scyliorhinus canicula]|uniref:complement C3-like isoform X2 n=1 Tax=Scyliorhinus canicula TaxID=7830 RepID=UPI0018F7835A|nr:complement C3-like isoform X2 [Scyliorhinus canicula]